MTGLDSDGAGSILVLGGGGMLGQAVSAAARQRGLECAARRRSELDLADTASIADHLDGSVLGAKPSSALINCAAFTAVDDCEQRVETAMEVNGHAVGRLARLCQERGLPLIHVSSDYVFDGDGVRDQDGNLRPYREDDPVGPASVYGQSKELGEREALAAGAGVVRASWLFGPGGPNFAATMLRLATQGESKAQLKVVNDQIGCPTYTPDLAEALLDLVSRLAASPSSGASGDRLFHFANPPAASWFDFAAQIFETFEVAVDLAPCTTEEFPRPAPRPAYSVLDTTRFERVFGRQPRVWSECLRDYRTVLQAEHKDARAAMSKGKGV